MPDSALPPSKFGAGYTAAGAASVQPAVTAAPAPLEIARVNVLAVVSFVGALFLGPIAAPVTLPLAYFARARIPHTGECGGRLANAAIIISIGYLMIGVVVAALYVFVNAPS
ncbi:hypothetical protein [Mycobacterium hubeiense]|uniref:hypothetical protein n=1 Tax=Mycobacterium hubeiense TaxID=1867256 RepID=UPI0011571E3B|nr:hypothetical protein [Mycobacterium sp. QGD 101]